MEHSIYKTTTNRYSIEYIPIPGSAMMTRESATCPIALFAVVYTHIQYETEINAHNEISQDIHGEVESSLFSEVS